jgi:hypothetical protein
MRSLHAALLKARCELFDGRRLWVLTVVETWSRMCRSARADAPEKNDASTPR